MKSTTNDDTKKHYRSSSLADFSHKDDDKAHKEENERNKYPLWKTNSRGEWKNIFVTIEHNTSLLNRDRHNEVISIFGGGQREYFFE